MGILNFVRQVPEKLIDVKMPCQTKGCAMAASGKVWRCSANFALPPKRARSKTTWVRTLKTMETQARAGYRKQIKIYKVLTCFFNTRAKKQSAKYSTTYIYFDFSAANTYRTMKMYSWRGDILNFVCTKMNLSNCARNSQTESFRLNCQSQRFPLTVRYLEIFLFRPVSSEPAGLQNIKSSSRKVTYYRKTK